MTTPAQLLRLFVRQDAACFACNLARDLQQCHLSRVLPLQMARPAPILQLLARGLAQNDGFRGGVLVCGKSSTSTAKTYLNVFI